MTGRTVEDNKMKTELKGIHLLWQQQVKIYYWKIIKKKCKQRKYCIFESRNCLLIFIRYFCLINIKAVMVCEISFKRTVALINISMLLFKEFEKKKINIMTEVNARFAGVARFDW